MSYVEFRNLLIGSDKTPGRVITEQNGNFIKFYYGGGLESTSRWKKNYGKTFLKGTIETNIPNINIKYVFNNYEYEPFETIELNQPIHPLYNIECGNLLFIVRIPKEYEVTRTSRTTNHGLSERYVCG